MTRYIIITIDISSDNYCIVRNLLHSISDDVFFDRIEVRIFLEGQLLSEVIHHFLASVRLFSHAPLYDVT